MATYIEIITSPNCPHSPKAVRVAQKVVSEMNSVILHEVSMITEAGRARAEQYGVESTPAIAVNGQIAYVGVPGEKRLKHIIDDAVREERQKTNYFF
jgi:small redox-active disulfide protein 1